MRPRLLAWWFLLWGSGSAVVGPFSTEADCNRVRFEVRHLNPTSCWTGDTSPRREPKG